MGHLRRPHVRDDVAHALGVAAELDRIMAKATKGVREMAEREAVDLRTASTMVAVARVAEATTLRGLYP